MELAKSNSNSLAAEQQFLSELLSDNPNLKVDVCGTERGFYVTFKSETSPQYILHTQRNKIRYFKSPSTLFSFLSEIGIGNVSVNDLDRCPADSYTRKNSARHQKRLKAAATKEK